MYDGLLLDHDGVIVTVDDRAALRGAVRAAFGDVGVDDPDPEAVRALTVGVDEADLVGAGRQYGVDPDALWAARDDRIRDLLVEAVTEGRKAPYGDAEHLRAVGVPMGVVSNNQTRIVERVLDHHGLTALFGTVVAREPTRDSLARKKPEPTFLAAAMSDLGVDDPLYVGDSESDVVAGDRAGVDTAFLRRPHNADRTLDATPTYEVEGLDEVAALVA